MADYACSPCSLSTVFTRTLRRCLALQICAVLSHSRYTVTYFIANQPSMRHPSHLLLIISITCLRCPQIIFPSRTGWDLLYPWTCPIFQTRKLDFRVPGGNSSILGTSGIVCYCALGSVLISVITPMLKPQSVLHSMLYLDFFSSA